MNKQLDVIKVMKWLSTRPDPAKTLAWRRDDGFQDTYKPINMHFFWLNAVFTCKAEHFYSEDRDISLEMCLIELYFSFLCLKLYSESQKCFNNF